MNKILNINLGGYAITIDDDAYEYLQAYLENIRRRFNEKEGRDEILGDIEARLGELIMQNMGARSIVMLPDVQSAVEIMGKPEDFGDIADSSSASGGSKSGKSYVPPIRTGRRLFRDEEDSVVAGICSGLSAYFGISDPVWMRLIFVLLVFISFGFWVPAYLLLWILVPAAQTAADRLAMRGEKINVDNIAREVEEGFERLSGKVNQMGADAKKNASGGQQMLNTGVTAIGQLFGLIIRFIGKFAAVIAIIIAISLFIAMFFGWIASIWGLIVAAPFLSYVSPQTSSVSWMAVVNAFFLLGIPLAGLCLLFLRILFKTRTPRWLGAGLTLFWVLNLVSAVFLSSFAVKEFWRKGSISKEIDLSGIRSDTLFIEGINPSLTDDEWDNFNFDEGDLRFDENQMEMNGMLEVRIREGSGNQFRCTQIIRSQGSSALNAQENAGQIAYDVVVVGNRLRIPTAYKLTQGQKWRAQRIRLNIEVPAGKSFVFDENIYRYTGADLDDYVEDFDHDNYMSRNPNNVYLMTGDGITCTSCPQLGDKNYRSDRRYEKFILEGNFDTEILEGNEFSVDIDASAADNELLKRRETGDKITFTTEGKTLSGKVKITIRTPVFTSLTADETGDVVIRGFEEGTASIKASGATKIKAYLDVSDALNVTLRNNASLTLNGKGNSVEATLSDNATLDANNWEADRGEFFSSDNSQARVFVQDDALIISTGNSEVKVNGGARIRNTRN